MRLMDKWKRRSRSPCVAWMCSDEAYDSLCVSGYSRLSDNPEVQMAVNYIAELIGSMTIYLMRNTPNGDVRVKDGLAKKVDINPCQYTTRKNWMTNIVKNMLLTGNQFVLPITHGGLIEDLIPLPPGMAQTVQDGYGYRILYKGKEFSPDEMLHFSINPDSQCPWRGMGYQAILKDVTANLRQAAATKKGFMGSKWKPSIIVKVDALTEEFSSEEGRKKLLEGYFSTSEAGEPWMIPAEQFEVEQIKPLSLNDLAINESVTLDKKTVAAIFKVPAYVVGAGDYRVEEHRNFINTVIMPISQSICQEMTHKLLLSGDLYFWQSPRSLYSYDNKELSEVGQQLYVRGIMTGNEVRGWLNMPPLDGLDERVILENYIPAGMIGEQKKLNQVAGGGK